MSKLPSDVFASPSVKEPVLNQLQVEIVREFSPRFVGEGGQLLYLGDTASSRDEEGKFAVLEEDVLKKLGLPIPAHDKLPDIIMYSEPKNWLFLVEAVTSHGPISAGRRAALEAVFRVASAGVIYVTAFPDRATFCKHAADVAWETEVWIAEEPDHLIHFDGARFLGPYSE